MAFDSWFGTVTAATATGSKAYTPTGLNFTGKIGFFWGTKRTSDGSDVGKCYTFGAAISSSDRMAGYQGQPNSGTGGQGDIGMVADRCWELRDNDGAGTLLAEADFVSWQSSGFTLTFPTVTASAYQIHVLVLGGADLSVDIGNFAVNTGTGSQPVTGVGFQPDAMVMYTLNKSTTQFGEDADFNADWAFGIASGADNEFTTSGQTRAVASQIRSYQSASAFISTVQNASDALQFEANLTSFNADGFTINISTADVANYYYWVALKCDNARVLNETQKTSTGTKAKTGAGFQPTVAFFISLDDDTLGLEANRDQSMIGATDGSGRQGVIDTSSNESGSAMHHYSDTAASLIHINAGTPTIEAEADLQSFDGDGYTLDWTAADSVARYHAVLLLGGAGLTREQEGFRFRDDDGSETTATWLANQDTNVTRTKQTNTRLRFLIDYSLNPPNEAPKVQWRKKNDPDTEWRDVIV
jgi:hypothetical protein